MSTRSNIGRSRRMHRIAAIIDTISTAKAVLLFLFCIAAKSFNVSMASENILAPKSPKIF
jgi:hypothetical protein